MIKIYNSLTAQKENFESMEKGKVKMYACGLTPQSSSHIGHAASAIRFAMIRKYLEFVGNDVTFVENITDIDDKIIIKSKETGKSVKEIAHQNYTEYRTLMSELGVPQPTFTPRATEYISKIITFIQELITKGYAYKTDNGDVYFDVSKKEDYFKLSKRKPDESLSGTRIEVKDNKQDSADFGLWKITDDGENYDSPWGKGRPGWHIECSTMANDLLGETLDIHCGGLDLLFPHHENEIAQSEAHSGHEYVKYWVHSGLLTINGEKMSKSLNNFITLKDAIDKYGTELLVWIILRHHYRSSIDFNDKLFGDNLNQILKFYTLFDQFPMTYSNEYMEKSQFHQELVSEFEEIMNDDFQTPRAIVTLQKYLDAAKTKPFEEAEKLAKTIFCLGRVIGLFTSTKSEIIKQQLLNYQSVRLNLNASLSLNDIDSRIKSIKEARINSDYQLADALRDDLANKGIQINYDKNGEYSWMFVV